MSNIYTKDIFANYPCDVEDNQSVMSAIDYPIGGYISSQEWEPALSLEPMDNIPFNHDLEDENAEVLNSHLSNLFGTDELESSNEAQEPEAETFSDCQNEQELERIQDSDQGPVSRNTTGETSNFVGIQNEDDSSETADLATETNEHKYLFDPKQKFDAEKMISDAIEDYQTVGFHIQSMLDQRGRPRSFRGIDYPELLNLTFSEMENRPVAPAKRADTMVTHFKRRIQSISSLMMRRIASATHYKNKNIALSLNAYIETFFIGFLPMFDPQREIVDSGILKEMFLNFIVLSFPKERVTKIFKNLRASNYMSTFCLDRCQAELGLVSKTALKIFSSQCRTNLALRLIVQKLSEIISTNNTQNTYSELNEVLAKVAY